MPAAAKQSVVTSPVAASCAKNPSDLDMVICDVVVNKPNDLLAIVADKLPQVFIKSCTNIFQSDEAEILSALKILELESLKTLRSRLCEFIINKFTALQGRTPINRQNTSLQLICQDIIIIGSSLANDNLRKEIDQVFRAADPKSDSTNTIDPQHISNPDDSTTLSLASLLDMVVGLRKRVTQAETQLLTQNSLQQKVGELQTEVAFLKLRLDHVDLDESTDDESTSGDEDKVNTDVIPEVKIAPKEKVLKGATPNNSKKAVSTSEENTSYYVGNVDKNCDEEDVVAHVIGLDAKPVEVKLLSAGNTYNSYKLTVPKSHSNRVSAKKLWPKTVVIQPFRGKSPLKGAKPTKKPEEEKPKIQQQQQQPGGQKGRRKKKYPGGQYYMPAPTYPPPQFNGTWSHSYPPGSMPRGYHQAYPPLPQSSAPYGYGPPDRSWYP